MLPSILLLRPFMDFILGGGRLYDRVTAAREYDVVKKGWGVAQRQTSR